MSKIICVTDRKLCGEDILQRVEKLAAARPHAIILREKDLSEEDYGRLAEAALALCRRQGVTCILHRFAAVGEALGCTALHLPLPELAGLSAERRAAFTILGASCHSLAEAREAAALGCTYITAGHVFDTDCKRGLPGRGLDFLRQVCQGVSLPVYAIGGVTPERMPEILAAGAAGACSMSGAMTCPDPAAYLHRFQEL